MSADVPEAIRDKYVTEAVESGVETIDGETVGHVCFLDLDETSLGAARDVASRLPGSVAILRSSSRSYHIWGLAIKPLDAWLDLAISLDAVDDEHVSLSDRRGCGVLRIDAKRDAVSGELVKRAPTVIGIETTSSRLPHSEPHVRLLRGLTSDPIEIPAGIDLVGERLSRRVYMAEIGGRR